MLLSKPHADEKTLHMQRREGEFFSHQFKLMIKNIINASEIFTEAVMFQCVFAQTIIQHIGLVLH